MRLKGISTKEEAGKLLTKYLSLYNREFRVKLGQKDNHHREIAEMPQRDQKKPLIFIPKKKEKYMFAAIHPKREF